MKTRLLPNMWQSKESFIKKKLLPYFGCKSMSKAGAKDIIQRQNETMNLRGTDGKIMPNSELYTQTRKCTILRDRTYGYSSEGYPGDAF